MKRITMWIAVLCAVMAFSACGADQANNAPVSSPSPMAVTPTQEPTAEPKVYLYASEQSQAGKAWTEVKSYSYDMDGDGKEEKMRLMTSAKKDSKGRLLIDDIQDWVVEMQDGTEVFTLFSGKVSNGCPYFEVYSDVDITKNYVRVLVSSSAQFIDKSYEFLSDKRAFEEVDTPESQNLIYSSLPYYE